MLDKLFLMLCLSDDTFYKGLDIDTKVYEALFESEERYGIYITGPKKFNSGTHTLYPLYAAYKTNTKDNTIYLPSQYGNVIISSINTGIIIISPLVYYPHKMPLPSTPEESPPPSSYDPSTEQFNFGFDKRTLKPELDFPSYSGKIAIRILCGNFASNKHVFEISGGDSSGDEASEYITKITQKVSTLSDNEKYYFTKTKFSPGIPGENSIVINSPEKIAIEKGKPCSIYGSFNVPGNTKSDETRAIPIHILISGKGYEEVLHHEIIVPGDMAEKQEKKITGYFMIDLMQHFFYKEGNRFDIPDEIFISAVHKDIFTGPHKIVLSKQ